MENRSESRIVKYLLIGISVLFLFVKLVLPLFVVVTEALRKGWEVYIEAVTDSYTIASLMLTLKATVIAVLCKNNLNIRFLQIRIENTLLSKDRKSVV